MYYRTYASVTVAYAVLYLCIDSGIVCGTAPYVSVGVPHVVRYLFIGNHNVCGMYLYIGRGAVLMHQ